MSKGKQWTMSAAWVALIVIVALWTHAAIAQNDAGDDARTGAPAYKLDVAHTAVVFRISHLGMSQTWGRFNEIGGDFAFSSAAPSAGHFKFAVRTASVDTNNTKRDDHLRSPDFFHAAQFPLISFRSTSITVGEVENTYLVSGELDLHGIKRPITLTMTLLGEGQDNWGNQRIGFATQFTIQRSAFGINHGLDAVGDDVELFVSFEGTR